MVNTHSVKEWFCGTSAFDVKFDKNFHFLSIFGKNRTIWVRPPKQTPFVPIGADLFVSLNDIGIQITEKNW